MSFIINPYNFGSAFNPLSLSPAVWLDASDASTLYDATTGGNLVAPNGTIARWEDKSGNLRHATQVSGTKPIRIVSMLNGLDVASFQLISDGLIIPYSMARPCTLFLVCNQVEGANRRVINSRTNNALIAPSRNDGYACYDGVIIKASSWSSSNEWLVTTLVSSISQTNLYKNGTNLNSVNNASRDWGLLGLGKDGLINYEGCFGNIAEILVFPTALSTTNRQAVESYLRTKWGTP
jgi:hypothetical protein